MVIGVKKVGDFEFRIFPATRAVFPGLFRGFMYFYRISALYLAVGPVYPLRYPERNIRK